MTGLARVGLVASRELSAERRQPDGAVAAVTFVAVLVLLESLVVGPSRARDATVAAALFWIALAFAAIVVAMRSFDRELDDDALDALVGGVLSLVLLDLPLALPVHVVLVVVLGVVALAPVVVVDVVLALRLRARAALVPILALPVLVPQLVSATQGAAAALTGDATAALAWSGILLAFALVYGVVGLTIVPAAIE